MAAATAHQLLEGGEGLEAEVAEEGELVGVAEVGQQQLGRGGGAGALGTLQHHYCSISHNCIATAATW